MEVEPLPALEEQRKAHPELGEKIDELQKFAGAKLYHQLTQAILDYLKTPALLAAASSELLDFFNGFIRPFESKFDKVRWVQILAIVCQPQDHKAALELVGSFAESVEKHRDAKYLWQALKGEKLTLMGDTDEAKELLDTLGKEIDDAYEVDALIQSQYHKTSALMWKHISRWQDFYKSSILYLAYTPMASIPEKERPQLAFEIAVAALIAEEEFNFGELLQQELLASLEGVPQAWIKDLLQAFGDAKFDMYDAAIAKHRAQIDATPQLKEAEASVLRPKMCALALMELAFRKPKKQRRLSFEEIAQHCRVEAKEVEYLLMKSMCAKLLCGKIDEVGQVCMVTWVKPRILDNMRVDLLRQRVDTWQKQTGLLLEHLEEMTPELLVS